jgi:peptidoglycan/LPS O-acetylase OafA/YrhL
MTFHHSPGATDDSRQGPDETSPENPGRSDGLSNLPPELRAALDKPHLDKIDALRAISALLVVFYHVGLPFPAGFGVLTFFVLSGFLITWLLLKEEARTGTISLRDFYVRRALRIFPAFYCYWILVTVTRTLLGRDIPWTQAWASFFYVGNYYQGLNGYPSSNYSHTWSLAIEEQFYILFPPLFVRLGRRPNARVAFVVAGIVFVWALRLLAGLGLGVPEAYLYTAFEMRADHLLVGCLLALVLHRGRPLALWRALEDRPGYGLLLAVLLIVSNVLQVTRGPEYRDTIGGILDPLCIALLIPTLLAAGKRPSVRWLDSSVLAYLGAISYSIYLYQQLVISPVSRLLRGAGTPEIAIALLVPLAVIAAATASYRFVEQPFLRMKHRFSPLERHSPSHEGGAGSADPNREWVGTTVLRPPARLPSKKEQ